MTSDELMDKMAERLGKALENNPTFTAYVVFVKLFTITLMRDQAILNLLVRCGAITGEESRRFGAEYDHIVGRMAKEKLAQAAKAKLSRDGVELEPDDIMSICDVMDCKAPPEDVARIYLRKFLSPEVRAAITDADSIPEDVQHEILDGVEGLATTALGGVNNVKMLREAIFEILNKDANFSG